MLKKQHLNLAFFSFPSSVSKLSVHFLNSVLTYLRSQMLNVINLQQIGFLKSPRSFLKCVSESSQGSSQGSPSSSVKRPRLLGLCSWWFWCHVVVVYEVIRHFFLLSKYLLGVGYEASVVLGYKKADTPQYCLIYLVHFG